MWNGFKSEEFKFENRDAIIVFPASENDASKLALKTEYWGAFPDIEINLLKNGFHLAFIKNKTRDLLPKKIAT